MNHKVLATLSLVLGALLVLSGAVGMLICFMFLWSSDMRDITGAGLGFVAGSIMLGSGSIVLALLAFTGTPLKTGAPAP